MTQQMPPQPQPGQHGRWFALVYVPGLALAGVIGGAALASSINDQSVASDFWSQILAVVGLSALPIVVVAMRIPAYAAQEWRPIATVAVFAAFGIVLVVFAVSMHQVAQVVPEGVSPPQPSDVSLYVACIGTGLILAAVACSVVIAFFEQFGSMEPRR